MAEKKSERVVEPGNWGPGARFLVVLGGAVVVIAGLRAGRPILLPFAVALFLAILSLPIMLSLQRRRVPVPIAIFLAVLVDIAIFGGIILIASQSMADFQGRLPSYVERFQVLLDEWIVALQARGLPAAEYFSGEFFSTALDHLNGFSVDNFTAFVSNKTSATFICMFSIKCRQMYRIFHGKHVLLLARKSEVLDLPEPDFIFKKPGHEEIKEALKVSKSATKPLVVYLIGKPKATLRIIMTEFKLIQASGGIVFNQKNEILLIKRLGKWDLPKGKIKKSETLEECAIREIEEETGAGS
jgi:hypothetical protein